MAGHLGDRPVVGGTRPDGSTITATVPEPIEPETYEHLHAHTVPTVGAEPPTREDRTGGPIEEATHP